MFGHRRSSTSLDVCLLLDTEALHKSASFLCPMLNLDHQDQYDEARSRSRERQIARDWTGYEAYLGASLGMPREILVHEAVVDHARMNPLIFKHWFQY